MIRGILNGTDDGIYAVDKDWNFIFVNERVAKLVGHAPEEMIGRNVWEFFPKLIGTSYEKNVRESMLKRQTKVFEWNGRYSDEVWEINAFPFEEGLIVTSRDITERKKTEEKLRESKNQLSIATKAAKLGVHDYDIVSNSVQWDSYIRELWGVSIDEPITYQTFIMGVHPDDRGSVQKEMDQALDPKGKRSFYAEYRVINSKDSAVRWVAATGQTFFRNDKPVRLVGTAQDITERRNIEEALKESEERLKRSQEIAHLGSWELDLVNDKLTWSDEVYRIFGLQPQEFGATYEAFLSYVHPSDRSAVDRAYSGSVLDGRDSYDIEHRVIRKDTSEVRFVYEKCTHIRDESGKVIRSIGMVHDITERKKAEEALARINEKFTEILEIIQDAFYVINKDWNIVFVNKQLCNKLGKQLKELVGKNFWELFPKYKGTIVEDKFRWAMEKREIRQFESDGKYTDVYYAATVYPSSEGITVFGVDITQRKQVELALKAYQESLERQIEERTKQLKDAERLAAIGATAGMVGHDIRNPLQAIINDLYLAEQELKSAPESKNSKNLLENLESIHDNVTYINKIVADLQDYARPLIPSTHETEIELVIKQTIATHEIPENINVKLEIEKNIDKVTVDPDFLKRILGNLILNAIQAMPEGGEISIHSFKDRETSDFLLTVKDTGVGIPENVKNKLFTPMFTTKSKGQGFGLSVVKRMTESLDGTVTFESQVGKGTTFIVRLPAGKKTGD